jgi:hypothetical protein
MDIKRRSMLELYSDFLKKAELLTALALSSRRKYYLKNKLYLVFEIHHDEKRSVQMHILWNCNCFMLQ